MPIKVKKCKIILSNMRFNTCFLIEKHTVYHFEKCNLSLLKICEFQHEVIPVHEELSALIRCFFLCRFYLRQLFRRCRLRFLVMYEQDAFSDRSRSGFVCRAHGCKKCLLIFMKLIWKKMVKTMSFSPKRYNCACVYRRKSDEDFVYS